MSMSTKTIITLLMIMVIETIIIATHTVETHLLPVGTPDDVPGSTDDGPQNSNPLEADGPHDTHASVASSLQRFND